jgi:hypothetical protein
MADQSGRRVALGAVLGYDVRQCRFASKGVPPSSLASQAFAWRFGHLLFNKITEQVTL